MSLEGGCKNFDFDHNTLFCRGSNAFRLPDISATLTGTNKAFDNVFVNTTAQYTGGDPVYGQALPAGFTQNYNLYWSFKAGATRDSAVTINTTGYNVPATFGGPGSLCQTLAGECNGLWSNPLLADTSEANFDGRPGPTSQAFASVWLVHPDSTVCGTSCPCPNGTGACDGQTNNDHYAGAYSKVNPISDTTPPGKVAIQVDAIFGNDGVSNKTFRWFEAGDDSFLPKKAQTVYICENTDTRTFRQISSDPDSNDYWMNHIVYSTPAQTPKTPRSALGDIGSDSAPGCVFPGPCNFAWYAIVTKDLAGNVSVGASWMCLFYPDP
jgi:hypothetical protein